ncbi:MAG TPA: LysR family transcriptional regulator [Clostridia bacterium]|nr:LysR family transcriptional regulator [Clostridia bacterium]
MGAVSYELYRTFWAIGKTGSVTKAAELLHVTQPNVSQALKSLEAQVGGILCERSKKGVTLTPEGRALFEALDQAVGHIEKGERQLESLLNLNSGLVSISASDTVCNYHLLPRLRAFLEAHPNIRLEVTNRTSLETLELVRSQRVDLGFVNDPPPDPDLAYTHCLDLTEVLVAGTRYRGLAGAPRSLAECLAYPLILLERKSVSRLFLDRQLQERGLAARPILELGSLDLIISFARNNFGLAFIPYELCGHLIDGETLFQVPLQERLPPRALAMVELKGRVLSHATRAFQNHVLHGKMEF